jgi:hypothetical protein
VFVAKVGIPVSVRAIERSLTALELICDHCSIFRGPALNSLSFTHERILDKRSSAQHY